METNEIRETIKTWIGFDDEERRLRAFHVNLVGRENVNLPVMRRLGHVEQEVLDADGVDKEVPL